jgi:hypothetical protein
MFTFERPAEHHLGGRVQARRNSVDACQRHTGETKLNVWDCFRTCRLRICMQLWGTITWVIDAVQVHRVAEAQLAMQCSLAKAPLHFPGLTDTSTRVQNYSFHQPGRCISWYGRSCVRRY